MLKMIAALANNRGIGFKNGLMWSITEDMRWFKYYTMDKTVVMGRKTWESLPEHFRPLPHRRNLVLTYDPQKTFDGAESVSMDYVLELAQHEDVVVIGGEEIYKLFLPHADQLALTHVDYHAIHADTFFPEYQDLFNLAHVVTNDHDPVADLSYSINIYNPKQLCKR